MERDTASYMYGQHTAAGASHDMIHVDDLLDFSNVDIFDPDASSASSSPPVLPALPLPLDHHHSYPGGQAIDPLSASFSDNLCFPSEDLAELEWLSKFVEDSFSDSSVYSDAIVAGSMIGNPSLRPYPSSVPGRDRSKRSRAAALSGTSWAPLHSPSPPSTVPEETSKPRRKEVGSGSGSGSAASSSSSSGAGEVGGRRCTHCATEKTPQWRTGPMGPKSLCNACGVRYKSGRLVPEYRPAASPTFVLTQHSNSHRKVMELRRQKEMTLRDQDKFLHDFKVC